MSRYLAQAAITFRKIKNGEVLDNFDVAIIDSSLTRTIQEQRVPFERYRDHFIIGTERFKVLSGLDYYRTILMNRKSDVWHPDSNRSELSAFEVYTAVQIEPPQPYNYGPDDATPDEYAEELGDRSLIGPSFSGSFQAEFDPEAIASMRQYAKELSTIDSTAALELQEELDNFLQDQLPDSASNEDGDLIGTTEAFIKNQYYRGQLRALDSPKKQVADIVRQATKYARAVVRNNPLTADIADYLKEYVKVGQVCDYRGDLKWRF